MKVSESCRSRFGCPCGCGRVLHMNLLPDERPCWRVTRNVDGTVTLHPSVWRKKDCGSHFWLRNGRIRWCQAGFRWLGVGGKGRRWPDEAATSGQGGACDCGRRVMSVCQGRMATPSAFPGAHGCRGRMVARRSMGREANVMEWRRHVRAVDSESRSAQNRRDDADCRGSRHGRQRRLREELRMNEPEYPILSRFGSDPEDIARGLREFSKSAVMLSNDRPRLSNEHPLQWIGVYRGEVSAKADDLPSLIEELERRGIPPGDTIVRFIEKNQRTLIL